LSSLPPRRRPRDRAFPQKSTGQMIGGPRLRRWLLAVLGIEKGEPLAPEGSRRSQPSKLDQEGRLNAGEHARSLSLLSLTGSLYERGNVLDNDTCLGGL